VFWPSLRRLRHIVAVVIRYGLAYTLGSRIVRWPGLARRLPVGVSKPELLRGMIEDLGGTFIKFGQMLALQPDILSLEYCNALFNLLDRVAPFGFEEVEKVFIEETGKSPLEVFDRFERQPIATASLGQVHIAYLDGRKLAVKVQRPTVESEFAGDIRLMVAVIRLVRRLHLKRLYWVIEPMSEFIEWTREEMDYRCEARYMDQLRVNARNNSQERVPELLGLYSSRRTLVAEFFEGATVLDYLRAVETGDELMLARLGASGFDPNRFACNIIDNFLSDAYRYGMFHADLHPANLMILPANVVGYIDFGITGVLSHYSRQNLVALTLAYTRADLKGMCNAFIKGSAMGPNADEVAFHEGLKKVADDWYGMRGKERRLLKNFTLVMLDMLRLSRKTDIWPERDVIKYIRSAIAIDGLITRFAPGFNVGQYLEMVCSHSLKWEARRTMFSYDALVGLSNSSGRLIRDGAFRAASFLDRLAIGALPARAEVGGAPEETGRAVSLRAIYLGAIVFAVALLITLTGQRVRLGANLFTAEAVLIAASAMMLLRTIRRLA
jgi:ubiquinone biosynthesis protein